jgi:hypothetical protein
MSILLNYLNDDEKTELYKDILKKERDNKLLENANKSVLIINNPLEMKFITNDIQKYIDKDTSNICLKYIKEEKTRSNQMIRVARYTDYYIRTFVSYLTGVIGYHTLEYDFSRYEYLCDKIQANLCSAFCEYKCYVDILCVDVTGVKRLVVRIGKLLNRDKDIIRKLTTIR